jgi:hypothetical protein
MGELALTDDVPQEQPEASGRGADCWGTCEELLLVSAVRRHGTSNWNLIASELKDRAISLSVCPVYFSEEVLNWTPTLLFPYVVPLVMIKAPHVVYSYIFHGILCPEDGFEAIMVL